VPGIFLGFQKPSSSADRCHSLSSLFPPPAAVGSLPSQKENRPQDNPRATKLTRYHLVSRQRTSHTAPFPASRKSRQWLGISSSPQRPSAFAGARFRVKDKTTFNAVTGVPGKCLPIDIPAPRPCSAAAFRAHSHLAGLSDRRVTAYSPLHRIYSLYSVLYPAKRPFVNSFLPEPALTQQYCRGILVQKNVVRCICLCFCRRWI